MKWFALLLCSLVSVSYARKNMGDDEEKTQEQNNFVRCYRKAHIERITNIRYGTLPEETKEHYSRRKSGEYNTQRCLNCYNQMVLYKDSLRMGMNFPSLSSVDRFVERCLETFKEEVLLGRFTKDFLDKHPHYTEYIDISNAFGCSSYDWEY